LEVENRHDGMLECWSNGIMGNKGGKIEPNR